MTITQRSWFALARKMAVGVIGVSVLACGVAMVVLPGPAVLVIPLGLAVLAREFPWARRLLDKIKRPLRQLKTRAWQMLGRRPQLAGPRVLLPSS